MKRSEALANIGYIIAQGFEYLDNPMKIAQDVLDEMEYSGMLPPSTMRYIDQENGNTLCSEVCEWDEENDS